jgi:glycosyltransferase involved in cell wall biosynthesis
MKIALVHDYLTQQGGAERVFELLCRFFPSADIFTSLYNPQQTIDLNDRWVYTTKLQQIPGATRYFRLLAPFYYPAFRALDLQEYDLIISSSSSFAKAVRKRPSAKHICFCHNITRFLWDTKTYLNEYQTYNKFVPILESIFDRMRKIDITYAQEPDLYIANSSVVARRIESVYQRKAQVINYPINSNKFIFSDQKDDFYVMSSRFLSYKRIDLAIEAFNWLGWPLLIMGDGPERKILQSKARSNIQFLGYVNDQFRAIFMSRARAVIVTALEDYGLVPVEANASGTPVIGFGAGGILDTQISEQTGILFPSQTPESLLVALFKAKEQDWDYQSIRDRALNHFSEFAFFRKVKQVIEQELGQKGLLMEIL